MFFLRFKELKGKIDLGGSWKPLGASWKPLGPFLNRFGSILEHLGSILASKKARNLKKARKIEALSVPKIVTRKGRRVPARQHPREPGGLGGGGYYYSSW